MESDPVFRREGADVHSDVTVSFSQAVLGGSRKIPGIHEALVLNVSPAATAPPTWWFISQPVVLLFCIENRWIRVGSFDVKGPTCTLTSWYLYHKLFWEVPLGFLVFMKKYS